MYMYIYTSVRVYTHTLILYCDTALFSMLSFVHQPWKFTAHYTEHYAAYGVAVICPCDFTFIAALSPSPSGGVGPVVHYRHQRGYDSCVWLWEGRPRSPRAEGHLWRPPHPLCESHGHSSHYPSVTPLSYTATHHSSHCHSVTPSHILTVALFLTHTITHSDSHTVPQSHHHTITRFSLTIT